jgi:hypothetical protein
MHMKIYFQNPPSGYKKNVFPFLIAVWNDDHKNYTHIIAAHTCMHSFTHTNTHKYTH